MRIVFMGTPEFASICLKELIENNHKIVGVVSVADKPAGRGRKLRQSAVAQLATEENLLLMQPTHLKEEKFIHQLQSLNADIFVVVAFRMLPKEVWQIPPKGTFNLHASLLPQYRGAAPINWAIINGETETGVTTFLIDEQIDTGNILLKEKVQISSEENAGDLHDKLVKIGKKLIIETIDGLKEEKIQPKPQVNHKNLKPAPKIFKEDCLIDWNDSIENIHNKIRGLSPYPAAWSSFKTDEEIKVHKIYKGHFTLKENPIHKIHRISFEKNQMIVHLKDGDYYIDEIQAVGKRRMPIHDFINGLKDKTNWFISN